MDDVLLQRQKSVRLWEGTAFWTSVGCSLSGAAAMLVAAPIGAIAYGMPQLVLLLPVLAVAMPLNALRTVSMVRIRAKLDFRLLAFLGIGEVIGTQALTLVFAEVGWGVFSFVLPIPVIAALKTALFWWFGGLLRVRVGVRAIRKSQILVGRSTAVFGSRLLTAVISQADYAVLCLISSSEVVGVYYFAFHVAAQPLRLLAGNFRCAIPEFGVTGRT